MPQFFPQFLITGIAFLLLLGAGYGIATIQAARAIPWDCADWQAFAHDDRTTAILESQAENRGKTLYCGVDQSDTFTKAETWEAGRDRNERDDTVYFGERGSFRGFIAAQEGWLTDGESGITGISIDRIFEFPREKKKRRRKKERYLDLVYGQEYPTSTLANPGFPTNTHGGPTTGYLIVNPQAGGQQQPSHIRGARDGDNGVVRAFGPNGAGAATMSAAQDNARGVYDVSDAQAAEWALHGTEETAFWSFEVQGGATAECRALGYRRATRLRWWYFDGDNDGTPNIWYSPVSTTPQYVYRAFRALHYTARCVGRYTPPSGG